MPLRQLVVSFIGRQDINNWGKTGEDRSPIFRLVAHLFERPQYPLADTRFLLLWEDDPAKPEQRAFVDTLAQDFEAYGWEDLDFCPTPLVLPRGPTDLDALYSLSWKAILKQKGRGDPEVVFNVTSGTAFMQATLILAAECLPLRRPRLFEMSKQHNVQEILLPYVIASRERRTPRGPTASPHLPEATRRSLLPHTVIDDPAAERAYAAIHKEALQPTVSPRLLVLGPAGSGKWHALRQFAQWRGGREIHRFEQEGPLEVPENACLLIRWLDRWNPQQLETLNTLSARRPDIAIGATFRTDARDALMSIGPARGSLPGATVAVLPSLAVREDFVDLGIAAAERLGIMSGKIRERLQRELERQTRNLPRGLHDLETLVRTAQRHSTGRHPDEAAFKAAAAVLDTEEMLAELFRRLHALDFAGGEMPFKDVVDDLEKAVVLRVLAVNPSKTAAERLLGLNRNSGIAEAEKRPWRTRPADPEPPG